MKRTHTPMENLATQTLSSYFMKLKQVRVINTCTNRIFFFNARCAVAAQDIKQGALQKSIFDTDLIERVHKSTSSKRTLNHSNQSEVRF